MKIVDCFWELANLDCRVAEVTVLPEEELSHDTISALEEKYDYIVLKLPVGNFPSYECATKARYAFIEAQLSIQKKMDSWNLSPKDKKLLSRFSAVEVTDVAGMEEVLSKITEKMFTTDRIYLDPAFGPEYSARRYRNWTRTAFEQGAILHRFFYKDQEIGYGLSKYEDNVIHGLLGGAYEGEGMGLIVPTGPLFIENRRIDWFKTKISANNTPVLRLYNHFNFEITNVEYVFVKYVRH